MTTDVVKKRILTNGNIMLRPYQPEDTELVFEAIRESLNELTPWLSFVHSNYCIEETREWLSKRDTEWQNNITYDFAIIDCEKGRFLGGCGINDISDKYKMGNLGYWVRTSETKKGVASAATRLLAKFAFEEIGLNRIEITADIDNLKSQRVAEKAGAKKEGILRNRICFHREPRDVYMFSIIPSDFTA